jgi:hypothetical protein
MRGEQRTNIHEAGHGVMAVLTGLRMRYITNIPDATTAGRMHWAPGHEAPFTIAAAVAANEPRARALVSVAGVAAVQEILGVPSALRGADDDAARAFAQNVDDDADMVLQTLCDDARRLFRNEHVRDATIAVATRLEREHIVTGVEVERRVLDVGLTRIEPLQSASLRTERPRHAAVLGSSAFVDVVSPRYFFINWRSQ